MGKKRAKPVRKPVKFAFIEGYDVEDMEDPRLLEKIREIEAHALEKLRHPCRSKYLAAFIRDLEKKECQDEEEAPQ